MHFAAQQLCYLRVARLPREALRNLVHGPSTRAQLELAQGGLFGTRASDAQSSVTLTV